MEYGLVLLWILTYLALAVAALPVAAWLFPRFPDHGASLTFVISLAIITSTSYWIGQVAHRPIALFSSLSILVLLSYFAAKQDVVVQWKSISEAVVVFALVFGFVVAVRAVRPAVYAHSWEMFLNFGLLKSLARSVVLPPDDMWFAGAPVRYHYGGYLVGDLLARLTGTETRFAYNLLLPGFAGILATSVYGLANAIAADGKTSTRSAGVFAVFFVNFASNTFGPVQLLLRALPDSVARRVAKSLSFSPELVTSTPFSFAQAPGFRPLFAPLEFPVFVYFQGGLHPHMMSTPFLVLLISLLFSYFITPTEKYRHRHVLLLATVPVFGLILTINSWSIPAAGGLVILAVAFASRHPLTLVPNQRLIRGSDDGRMTCFRNEITRYLSASVLALLLTGVGVLFVFPYYLRMPDQLGIGLFPPRSDAAVLLLVHGAFLIVFTAYLLLRAWQSVRGRIFDLPTNVVILAGAGVLVGLVWLVHQFAALALYGPLLVLAWILLRLDADVGFESVMIIAGAGLVLLVELAYLKDPDPAAAGRYNTIFKTYFQVWIIWGIAAGVALANLMAAETPIPLTRQSLDGVLRTGFVVAVLLSLSLYGGVTAYNHFTAQTPLYGELYGRPGDPSLNAMAHLDEYHPGEAAAIFWLDNRTGQPHIVSAVGNETFQWHANPAATLTGLPTIAGWEHAALYHGERRYRERAEDVRKIYIRPSELRLELLRKYEVQYVYVGPEERKRYGSVSFDQHRGISIAFQTEAVTIYAVNESAFADKGVHPPTPGPSTLEQKLNAFELASRHRSSDRPFWLYPTRVDS